LLILFVNVYRAAMETTICGGGAATKTTRNCEMARKAAGDNAGDTLTVGFRIDAAGYARLQNAAQADQRTIANLVKKIVTVWLDQNAPDA
jgi:hypothetical protein